MMQPQVDDLICDPASGTAGFLVASAEYMNEKYSDEHQDRLIEIIEKINAVEKTA